jgi:dUTP pyrophosphatase
VIDASYRGEIMCRFHGMEVTRYSIGNKREIIYNENKYKVGERVAQIVFMELPKITLIEAQELSETERGSGGFGHTGK